MPTPARGQHQSMNPSPSRPTVPSGHPSSSVRPHGSPKRLAAEAIRIEHIGSTAMEGLAAKPVIDVVVSVSDLDATAELARRVTNLSYEDCGGDSGRRYFRKRDGQHFNVQVIEYKSAKWRANLLLRDYLRTNPRSRAPLRRGKAKGRQYRPNIAGLLEPQESNHRATAHRRGTRFELRAVDWPSVSQ